MKKIAVLFLSFMLVFCLAACGNNSQVQNTTEPDSSDSSGEVITKPETSKPTTADSSDAEPETTESTDNKVLVVYYSATGNTEEAANYIAGAIGADLFELKPTEIYSDADLDWTDSDAVDMGYTFFDIS